MSNLSQSSKLTDPKHLEMAEKYQDKFADKEAYEEADITGWSGIGVFALHAIIAAGSVMAIYYLNISKAEKTFLSVFVLVLAGVLEYFKSKYMERYFHSHLKASNVNSAKDTRLFHQKKKAVSKNILMAFWGASVVIFMAGGMQYAVNNMGNTEKLGYDTSLQASLSSKTKALESARLNGAGSGRLRQLAEDQTRASQDWQNHKKQIDGRQDILNASDESSTWTWAIIALVICIGLECGLFFLRGFHEGEQYKIAMSLLDGSEQGSKSSPTPSVQGVNWEEKYKLLSQRVEELKKLKEQPVNADKHLNDILQSAYTTIEAQDLRITELLAELNQPTSINDARERLVKQ